MLIQQRTYPGCGLGVAGAAIGQALNKSEKKGAASEAGAMIAGF